MKQPKWFGGAVIAGAFVLAGAVGVTANAQTPTAPGTQSTNDAASPCPSPSASNSMVASTLQNDNCASPKPSARPSINPVASTRPGPVASPIGPNGTSGTMATPGTLATPGAMTTPQP